MGTSIRLVAALALPLACCGAVTAAEPCRSDALGTSRTIVVDPREHPRVGTMSYLETLPLADKEVVLTFDDGPLPPYTNRVLDTLASECVRATYFIIGTMAKANPGLVRRIYDAGHTVGTHSMTHPQPFRTLGFERTKAQIDNGIEATTAALGEGRTIAPFFRFPGLGRTDAVEDYLGSRGLMAWSADFPADDWRHIGASEIIRRALRRLDAKGKGILLLHDIQAATATALPTLLEELKARGYRIVHVEFASADRPQTITTADAWRLNPPRRRSLPVLLASEVQSLDTQIVARGDDADLCALDRPRPHRPIALARAHKALTGGHRAHPHKKSASSHHRRRPRVHLATAAGKLSASALQSRLTAW